MAPSDGTSDNRTPRDPTWRYFLYAAVAVVTVLVVAGWLIYTAEFSLSSGDEWERRGQFGDMFGAVNALFSGLAFAGVIIAVVLQKNELALQRSELALNRQELSRSAEALGEQVQMLERSSSLSAIDTLITYYGRKLANIAEDDVRLKQELRDTQERLRSSQGDFADKRARLRGPEDELYRIRQALADPQTTDPDNRARLETDRQNLLVTLEEQRHEVDREEQHVRRLSEEVQRLEACVVSNNNDRDNTNHRHEALVSHLEQLVDESINQSIS